MALVKCSECQKEISDKAEVCPHCGNPMHAATTTININTPDTIKIEPQLVSKGWKKVKIIGWYLVIIGFLSAPIFTENGHAISWLIVIIGFGTLIVGKIGAWYEDRTVR